MSRFQLYERHSVREYWIADPFHQLLEIWVLVKAEYTRQGLYGPTDHFKSTLLDQISLEDIFKT